MVLSSLLLALACAVSLTLQAQQYFGLIVGDFNQGHITKEGLENIVHQHSSLDTQVSVKAVKPSFDKVFDYVMKLDNHEDQEGKERALKKTSAVQLLETMLEDNNGLMIELVMSETEFDQNRG